MPNTDMLTLRANAKINLVLSVGKRTADGYHSIDSVMQTVDIFDRLHIKKSDGISVRSDNAPQGEDNICYKAAMFFSSYGGVDVFIEKNIPLSAGLGGGSADAAAVLLVLTDCLGIRFATLNWSVRRSYSVQMFRFFSKAARAVQWDEVKFFRRLLRLRAVF